MITFTRFTFKIINETLFDNVYLAQLLGRGLTALGRAIPLTQIMLVLISFPSFVNTDSQTPVSFVPTPVL